MKGTVFHDDNNLILAEELHQNKFHLPRAKCKAILWRLYSPFFSTESSVHSCKFVKKSK